MLTAQFVLQSKDPLKTLVAVTQDFPKYQRRISKIALNATLKDAFRGNWMVDQSSREKVWLNNQPIPQHKMNPFKYVGYILRSVPYSMLHCFGTDTPYS